MRPAEATQDDDSMMTVIHVREIAGAMPRNLDPPKNAPPFNLLRELVQMFAFTLKVVALGGCPGAVVHGMDAVVSEEVQREDHSSLNGLGCGITQEVGAKLGGDIHAFSLGLSRQDLGSLNISHVPPSGDSSIQRPRPYGNSPIHAEAVEPSVEVRPLLLHQPMLMT
ncbi:hypothetical protein [Streptomyces cucumeris]|uniref:hypothetical protein n=1 Tax=Streptomyces cucumeris TaxID=2962890 RepID=UPI0020C8FFC4|nr:hypothetical protein [Streptomyces sp. NEAU-Y11]MCP9209686.1 hypothetical protein [Streptomyces sp. NEAU-Y11]